MDIPTSAVTMPVGASRGAEPLVLTRRLESAAAVFAIFVGGHAGSSRTRGRGDMTGREFVLTLTTLVARGVKDRGRFSGVRLLQSQRGTIGLGHLLAFLEKRDFKNRLNPDSQRSSSATRPARRTRFRVPVATASARSVLLPRRRSRLPIRSRRL